MHQNEILSAEMALRNALHIIMELIQEFRQELETYGRIYIHRLRPDYEMRARPIDEYPGNASQSHHVDDPK
jgi:urocanate hydratase